jgi:predicted metalloprotease
MVGGGIGAVVLTIVALLLGVDPSDIGVDPGAGTGAPASEQTPGVPAADDTMYQFVSVVLADTEDTWNEVFAAEGADYREPTLEVFSDMAQSACGYAGAAVGPFYCPLDEKVYIDLSFFRDLRDQLGAPGNFAQAYVVAHEVGHHVQTLLGITQQTASARERASQTEANAISVRQELQADCFAGIWANHARTSQNVQLEQGDIEAGLNAAAAIGDDRLQRRSQGTVVPESFTHGSSAQRVEWFRRGYESGDVNACDTFGG